MRVFVCFDDTDTLDSDRGTGKLVRWYADAVADRYPCWGVVRQQLLVHPDVPYTSHNSSACAVLDAPAGAVAELAEEAADHVAKHFIDGSDPGVCVVAENDPVIAALVAFGRRAAVEVVAQADAFEAAGLAHLSAHGGTGDGVIGAAAGVGLTSWGWSGRFIEFGKLRDWPALVRVGDLEAADLMLLPVDRNVVMPAPDDMLDTQGWLRPRLWGGRACVPVVHDGPGRWVAVTRHIDVRPPADTAV